MTALVVSGELDREAARELTPHLLDLASGGGVLALDLSGVCLMDHAGLQMLLAVRREAARACTHLALANPSPAVSAGIRRYRLEVLFNTRTTSNSASLA